MSISIVQTPATCSLAQSPIVFSVNESNTAVIGSSSFAYVADLYYWTGSVLDSGSYDYQLVKYPNTAKNGIFELSNIINSTLRDLAQENTSNVLYYACDFYYQYLNGSGVYVTGSHTKSSVYQALDGYGIFPEQIGAQINTLTPYWPIMTDGPSTQSVFTTNYGSGSIYVNTAVAGANPTKIFYSSSLGTYNLFLSSSTNTTSSVFHFPMYPSNAGFPFSTSGLTSYTITAYQSSSPLNNPIRFEVDCIQKYPNVRIKWKNRYGQFDFFNFYMVNRKSFSTMKKTYQPQLGTWQSSTLSYRSYDSQTLNYIVDSKQAISVNTFWISEDYNDILKQLLVSDEVYWVTNESTDECKPITIATSNIVFKTGVVDKLIQYQFDFNFGQGYKLIL